MLGNGRRNAEDSFLEGIAADEARRDLSKMMTMGIESMLTQAMPVTMLHTRSDVGDADAGPAGNAGVAAPGSAPLLVCDR